MKSIKIKGIKKYHNHYSMVNRAETNISGLTLGGKAIPLAGFSSTHGIHHASLLLQVVKKFRVICKFRARWLGQ
jgi:hypothetical protein